MKTKLISAVLVLSVLFVLYALSQIVNPSKKFVDSSAISLTPKTIRITQSGFVPEELEIHRGDTVIWINEDTELHWPASDLHPTHELYSEFDPHEPIPPGKAWLFRFNQSGEWRFHDHLKPQEKGVIKVQ